jgi:hypothetical protein
VISAFIEIMGKCGMSLFSAKVEDLLEDIANAEIIVIAIFVC